MATANFTIKAEDGWVAVTSAGVAFIRIHANPDSHAIFVTTGATLPAATVVGFKVLGEDFWCDVPVTDNFYVRVPENIPVKARVDVFYVAS